MGIITMLCSLFGCSAQTEGFKSLTVKEYAKAIEDTAIVRLDVRTAEEFAEGHIAKTLNIDVLKNDFESKAVAMLPKNHIIAVKLQKRKAKQERSPDTCKERIQGDRTRWRL